MSRLGRRTWPVAVGIGVALGAVVVADVAPSRPPVAVLGIRTTSPSPSPTTAAPSPSPSPTAARRTPVAKPKPTVTRRPTPAPTYARPSTPAAAPTRIAPRPPVAPAPPVSGTDNRVFVEGDSVLLGARYAVPAALPGWRVTMDTVGSRRLPQAIEVLRARRGEIGRVVVIQMGNNYLAAEGSFGAQIDQAMTVLRGVPRVVWLTVAEKWPSRVLINRQIRAAAARWPAIRVADWARALAAHPEYAADMLHLSPAGRTAIAALIAAQVGPAPHR